MRIAASLIAALLLSALSGCQLAREEEEASRYEDRLIGVFLTTEYLDLFDLEGYLNDNIGRFPSGEVDIDGAAEKYQGRLYAELRPKTPADPETGEGAATEEYSFPGVEGIAYFSARVPAAAEREGYVASESDEAVSDGHTSLNYGDQGNSTIMEGTVYVSPGHGRTYYFNPVYQSADGRVYAIAGSGFSAAGVQDEGSVYSQTLNAAYTITENGRSVTDSVSVTISISVMNPPEKIAVLQMGADSSVVSRTEYMPGEMPETIAPEKNTEYIVAETRKTGRTGGALITRKLYGRDAGSLEAFFCREDGVCVKQWVQIDWGK